MSTIVFIGYRGSGKSTLGRWLANEVDLPFVDSDDEVLKRLGFDSVASAWAAVGEEGWREAEMHVIPSLFEQEAVISLGGGAPLLPLVKKAMATAAIVFNLTASEEETVRRIADGSDRPELIRSNAETRLDRLPMYAMLGTFGINTSNDIDSTKAEILNFIEHGHQFPRTGRPTLF